jgi:hypothetical protein
VKFQRGARDVFSLGHTDEVAQMPKLHRERPRILTGKTLIAARYKEARKKALPGFTQEISKFPKSRSSKI